MEKQFATEDVLTAVVGLVCSDRGMDAVYDVLNWMSGESLFSHQFPRVVKEARPVMFAKYPILAEAMADCERGVGENWRAWRDEWVDRIGPTMTVVKLTEEEHERIDPLSEAAESFPPGRVFSIVTSGRRG